MPIWGVVMGQGISVANLGANVLYTGPIRNSGDAIQSCSAVIFANQGSGAAGLFHFPSGSINDDHESAAAIGAVAQAVQPDRAWIVYGVSVFEMAKIGINIGTVQATAEGEQLRSFVLALAGKVQRRPAKVGSAAIAWVNGAPRIIDDEQLDAIDLSGQAAGHYGGHVLHGRDRA